MLLDNIGHAINAALATDPSNTLVVSFDWANAFNTPSRIAFFAEVAATYPSLLPFVNLVYGAHTTVRFFTHPSGPCLLYTSPSPRDRQKSRMPSSA